MSKNSTLHSYLLPTPSFCRAGERLDRRWCLLIGTLRRLHYPGIRNRKGGRGDTTGTERLPDLHSNYSGLSFGGEIREKLDSLLR